MISSESPKNFPVVGIGASAGGIESFKKFVAAIPEDSGMAFILVQHLSPSHESILPEILSQVTGITVQEIKNDCAIEPNQIYVLPENKILKIVDFTLKLFPREASTLQMPIDVFFTSLAKEHRSRAIGVVLSGSAHDGTVGLKEIQHHGGITVVETPALAGWPSMPKSAVDAKVVDFILAAEDIPGKLVQIRSVYATEKNEEFDGEPSGSESKSDAFKKILSFVLNNKGVDFNYYKKPTVFRRINRRMAINQMEKYEDYLNLLRENRVEQEALFQDLLIKVTSFFRDPEVFEELCSDIFPRLLKNRSIENPIRIWIAGCSTGEEVYSMAICIFEALGGVGENTNRSRSKIQFFATDVSETAIQKARMGVYRTSELEAVSEQRLKSYFTKTDGSYRVIKPLRDTIVFAVHNFLKDPPFSKVDLISCRNVFIYFDPYLQKKALTTFHYALKEKGLLLLGNSETPGKPTDLFATYSKRGKLFSRKSGTGHFTQTISRREKPKKTSMKEKTATPSTKRTDFKKSAESILISKYSPTSVIIDEHLAVVDFSGNLEPFLELPNGKPSHELLKMSRKALAFELRNAVHKAKASQETVVKEGIPVKYNQEEFSARIEIIPLTDIVAPHYLIIFQKKSPNSSFLKNLGKRFKSTFSSSEKNHLQKRYTALEKELEQVRDDVRAITEEQEAHNEELQSANEELLSSNEEMQSLNEELETSKEEVQSTNEELIVVNRELIEKQDEISDTLEFLDGIIATIHNPFIVLEKDFRIQKVNASFSKMFELNETQVEGKSLFEIQKHKWNNQKLRTLLGEMLVSNRHLVDEEITLRNSKGVEHIYLFNAREIIRKKGESELILLSISDITHRKKFENELQNSVAILNKTNDQLDRYMHLASHDLQEPLRKIMIFANRIMDNGNITDSADVTMMGKIENSALRMSGLVKGLLEYSRVAHHGALFETIDLNKILNDIISDFELVIEEKNAKISIDELPEIFAIPLQIGQLFNNLIGNALKFNKVGLSPEINITSQAFPTDKVSDFPTLVADREYVELIIADKGIGFNPKYKEQIFLIFQRLRQSKNLQGSGIGLSLVKKIVENHDGAIFTVSEEGEGAEFHVILPIGEI